MKRFKLGLLLVGAISCTPLSQAALTNYGAGNISDTINPASHKCVVDYGNWIHNAGVVQPGVSSCDPIGTPTPIYPQLVAPAANKPTMTHRWWGSIPFLGEMRVGNTAQSGYITPDPMTARVTERGVRILGIPSGLRTSANEYVYAIPDPFSEVFDGIAVGNSNYNNLDAYLKDYSDGSVTVQWNNGNTPVMEATFVHGSPYAYFTALQGNLVIRTKSPNGGEKGTFYQSGNTLGVWTEVAGNRNNYLITGHDATTFGGVTGSTISVNNASKRMTVTLLPQITGTPGTAMIQAFAQHAPQRVNEVRIDYAVDRANNTVTVNHAYRFNGAPVTTMAGLLPLHWKNSNQAVTGYKVRSARGVTKFSVANGFSYTIPFVGVLPFFPELIGDYSQTQLRALVTEFINQGAANWNTANDTYWAGKNYGKVAELAAIARSHGWTTEANQLTNWLKGELEDWFRANTTGALDSTKYFVYDSNWNTLLGFDESFGAHQQLNDHHFHYGYFVRAAAEICRVDANWCSASQYGPMVELLIRDYAGGRNDPLFPYLRNFDPAYGFSWASGHANFVLGNNNESTSEAANAYGAIVLYGLITGKTDLVERGMYLHASSTSTFWEYWNNIDRYKGLGGDYDNFPAAYTKPTTSIIWGNGHVFSTWFSGAYAHILGIQGLPLSPLVLHIGQHADYLEGYVALGMQGESSNGKPSGLPNGHWRDVWWNIWAMTNGEAAANDLQGYGFNYPPEEGETKAHTYHWVHTLKQLGHLATGTGALTANYPGAVAFDKNGIVTYIAYNFGCGARAVTFSDGMSLTVPANSFRVKKTGQGSDSPPASTSCNGSSSSSSSSVSPTSSSTSSSSSSANSANGYTVLSANSVRFYANNSPWADIHYTINNGPQQNIRMTASGGNNTYELGNIPANATVRYFYTLGLAAGGAMDTTWVQFTCCSGGTASSSSSSSSSAPAFTVLKEAESFSNMQGVQTETTSDVGAGDNVGWIDVGDWMAYGGITIPTSGNYRVEYRVASPNGAQLSLDLNGGAVQLGQVAIGATGDWQNWTTVQHTVQLNAGTYSFGVYAVQGGWNFNWFRITRL